MCGIFGIVGRYDTHAARKSLEALAPRGPDGFGFDEEAGYFLGQTRLAIMDTDQNGGVYNVPTKKDQFKENTYSSVIK